MFDKGFGKGFQIFDGFMASLMIFTALKAQNVKNAVTVNPPSMSTASIRFSEVCR
jgi:hypothetical protein